jgi:S1-C subfamily serine protease
MRSRLFPFFTAAVLSLSLGAGVVSYTAAPAGPSEVVMLLTPCVRVVWDNGPCGSGVVIYSGAKSSVVLTAGHLIPDEPEMGLSVDVFSYDSLGKQTGKNRVKATVLAFDRDMDLAILSIPGQHMAAPVLDSSHDLQVGQECILVGCPMGKNPLVTTGVLSQFEDYQVASCPIFVGNSGGPLMVKVDGRWQVVGIASRTLGDGREYLAHMGGRHVSIENIWSFLADHFMDTLIR